MDKNFNELATALCQFQSKMHAVGKNKEGYGYRYPTLGKVIEFAYPVMTSLGMSVSQVLDQSNGEPAVTTVLFHTSGQFLSGTYPISQAGMKGVNAAQQFGAAISYARRYGLLSVLGLAAEDDDAHCLGDDANKKINGVAKEMGMEAQEVLSKAKCLKALDKATNGEIVELYKTHKAKAEKEKWHQALVDACAARKDELSNE